jgi:hypothetical protein
MCRLPKLDLVKLRVEGNLRPMSMGTVLYSMRTQLASVRSLHLHSRQSWAGAVQAWRELGKLTGLTKLELEFREVRPCMDAVGRCMCKQPLRLSAVRVLANVPARLMYPRVFCMVEA